MSANGHSRQLAILKSSSGAGVAVGVSVAGIRVGGGVSVGWGVAVGVLVAVGVGLGVDVAVFVAVGVGVLVAVAVGVNVGTGVNVAVGVLVAVAVGVASSCVTGPSQPARVSSPIIIVSKNLILCTARNYTSFRPSRQAGSKTKSVFLKWPLRPKNPGERRWQAMIL